MMNRIHMKILRWFGVIALPLVVVLSLPASVKEKLPDGPIGTWIKQNNALRVTEWMSMGQDPIRIKEKNNNDPNDDRFMTEAINSALGSSDNLIMNTVNGSTMTLEKKEPPNNP